MVTGNARVQNARKEIIREENEKAQTEYDVHLSTEHFTVTTSDIDPVFHICDSANKFSQPSIF